MIGDYRPRIWNKKERTGEDSPIKRMLEEHVREQLSHYFPGILQRVTRDPIERLRSEFFLMKSSLWEAVREEWKLWPWDPIPQILVHADQHNLTHTEQNRLRVERVWLGMFHEKDPQFDATKVRIQIWRTAYQIASEWLRTEHMPGLRPETVIAVSTDWHNKTEEGNALAFRQLQRILACLSMIVAEPRD